MDRPSNISETKKKLKREKETVLFFHNNTMFNQIFLEILLTDTFMLIVVSLLYSDLSSLNIKLVEMEASARNSRCVLLLQMKVEKRT